MQTGLKPLHIYANYFYVSRILQNPDQQNCFTNPLAQICCLAHVSGVSVP